MGNRNVATRPDQTRPDQAKTRVECQYERLLRSRVRMRAWQLMYGLRNDRGGKKGREEITRVRIVTEYKDRETKRASDKTEGEEWPTSRSIYESKVTAICTPTVHRDLQLIASQLRQNKT